MTFPAQEKVRTVTFNASGDHLLTRGYEPRAYSVLDKQGNPVRGFQKPQSGIWKIESSHTGNRILISGKNNTVKLQNLQGEILLTLNDQRIQQVKFIDDEERFVTVGIDNTVVVFDKNGNPLFKINDIRSPIESLNFNSKRNLIMIVTEDGAIHLHTTKGGKLKTIAGASEDLTYSYFCPRSDCLVTETRTGSTKLWNFQGDELASFRLRADSWLGNAYGNIDFNISEDNLVALEADGVVRLWDLEGNQLKTLEGHAGTVAHVEFSSDGRYIITYETDDEDSTTNRIIKIWDLQGKEVFSFDGVDYKGDPDRAEEYFQWSVSESDGKIFIRSDEGEVGLWDISGSLVTDFSESKALVESVRFISKHNRLITHGQDGSFGLWDLQGNQISSFEELRKTGGSLSFTSLGEGLLYASHPDGKITLWDLDGNEEATFKGHDGNLDSRFRFRDDGSSFITYGQEDDTTRLWNKKGVQLASFEGNVELIDGDMFLAQKRHDNAYLWDTKGNHIATFNSDTPSSKNDAEYNENNDSSQASPIKSEEQSAKSKIRENSLFSAKFSPNGKNVLTINEANQITLWDLTGQEVATYTQGTLDGNVNAQFSPDSQKIITWGEESPAHLWNVQGDLVKILEGSPEGIQEAKFNTKGNLATLGKDGVVHLWTTMGERVATLEGHPDGFESIKFNFDGDQLLTTGKDNVLRLWSLQGQSIDFEGTHRSTPDWIWFDSTSQYILSTGEDNIIRRSHLNGQEQSFVGRKGAWVKRIAANEKILVTADANHQLKSWDIDGNELATLNGHKTNILGVRFEEGSNHFVSWDEEGIVNTWNLEGRQLTSFQLPEGHQKLHQVRWSKAIDRIVTLDENRMISIWTSTGELVDRFSLENEDTERNQIFLFGPKHARIISRDGGIVQLWNFKGKLLAEFDDDSDVLFSPEDNRLLVTFAANEQNPQEDDYIAQLWDPNGKRIASFEGVKDGLSKFNEEGTTFSTVADGNELSLWDY